MVAITVKKVLEQIPGNNTDIVIGIFYVLLFVIIHNATALGTGLAVGKLAKCPAADCRTLTIETGIQNSGLGLALLFNTAIFAPADWANNGGMVLITALWGVWHIVSGLSIAAIFRRTNLAK